MKPTRPIQQIYTQLPDEFDRNDIIRLLKRHHRTIPALEVIYRYKTQGLIRNTTHGRYMKLPVYATTP